MTGTGAPGQDTTAGRAHALATLHLPHEDRHTLARFLLGYQSGIDEVATKLRVLQQEFQHIHDYNPIEHVATRLKSPESLLEKVRRRGCEPTLQSVREQVTDIAGVRVVCSFVSDVYRVQEMLCSQDDVRVLQVKDYIASPKPNGYRSLHAIIEIPVFFSSRREAVPVEVQFRTIAMDFWASLEHKIFYKYSGAVPEGLLDGLQDAARTAARLDADMEQLHSRVSEDRPTTLDRWNLAHVDDSTARALSHFLGVPEPQGDLMGRVNGWEERPAPS